MKCLLAIPMVAGLLFPPTVSAQFRLGSRQLSTAPAKATRSFTLHSSKSPVISTPGGAFSVVSPFRVETRSPWMQPASRPGLGREFGGRRFHRQRIFFASPYWSAPFPYANYGYEPQMFYPSLWPPLDQQYLQARQIAHGDVAGEVASQQNELITSQIQALSQEVEALRQEKASLPVVIPQPAVQRKFIATVFVYRDGRSFLAHDYAIFNQTLWVFGTETIRKIPLASLDLPATLKLNEDRGVDVALPEPQ